MHTINHRPVGRLLPAVFLFVGLTARGEIPRPDDAPRPHSPAESLETFRVPAGLKVQLVAAEPLIQQPSGICWDAQGRLYVAELHGSNLEGQFDIEELNKTGQLDTEVRRIAASAEAKAKAAAETFGTVKRLADTDGDGVAEVREVLFEGTDSLGSTGPQSRLRDRRRRISAGRQSGLSQQSAASVANEAGGTRRVRDVL